MKSDLRELFFCVCTVRPPQRFTFTAPEQTSLRDKSGPILLSSRKSGFLGMIISLKSVIIAERLFKCENFTFLMTYKLCQDHLETFFGAIRSQGGFNNNPSAREFKSSFKRLLVKTDISILHNSNWQILDHTSILKPSDEQNIEALFKEKTSLADHDYIHNFECNLTEYAQEVIIYIAGFVTKSISKHLQCAICKQHLFHSESLSHLQIIKSYGVLTNASRDVIEVCMITEKILRSNTNENSEPLNDLPDTVLKFRTHGFEFVPPSSRLSSRRHYLKLVSNSRTS